LRLSEPTGEIYAILFEQAAAGRQGRVAAHRTALPPVRVHSRAMNGDR
jgi:hypothetical protein